MKPTMFFLMNSIDIKRGGLTRASLKQASFFAEMGYDTQMLTFNFNPRYPLIRKKLIEMDRVHKNVIIRNMYEELAGNKQPLIISSQPKARSLKELSQGLPFEKRNGHNAYRVYDNGVYIKYISLHDDGTLDFIDYFNENRYRTKREMYDLWGNISRVSYMDLLLNKQRQLIYYKSNEQAFFTQWNNPEDGEVQRIILFNKDGSPSKHYINDHTTHKVDWLKSVIDGIKNEKSVIVSDTRSTDETLINLDHPKAAKVWRLHSNHLRSPYKPDSAVSPRVQSALHNIDCFDAAVFLTKAQKYDVMDRVGEKSNICVIPHFHEKQGFSIKSLFKPVAKNASKAVVVSRLSTLKRIDHIIRAFEIVIKTIPDAQLEIWGTGSEKAKLKRLIKDLNLQNNVFLKGYTHTPDEIYQKGAFSVLTSKSEGFALSVLESMYNKTPVISYNVRYGPADMITNNKNGYLVENGNIDELASKMIYLFQNPQEAKRMGERAKKHIEKKFNKKEYEQQKQK